MSVRTLSKSFSTPGLAPAVVLGIAPGSAPLLVGTLYVSRTADSQGPATWELYRFTHHADGSVSFRRVQGNSQVSTSQNGDSGSLGGVQSHASHDEFFLDADWRQPFVAAPWKPLSRTGAEPLLSLPGAGSQVTKDKLFPFSLSYAPTRSKPGDTDLGTSRRRTVVLAANSARARAKWLATFVRKAYSPELRSGGPANPPSAASVPSGRQVALLGEEHIGLPVTVGRGVSMPRLPAGPACLFDSHSSLRIVRDLLDGYASDPLSQNSKGQVQCSTDSDSSGTGLTPTSKTRKPKFLERYLDRQAEIENLLDKKWTATGVSAPVGSASSTSRRRILPSELTVDKESPQCTALGGSTGELIIGGSSLPLVPERLQLADKTTNVTLEGSVLSNAEWSGGAILSPPDGKSFRLTICPLDPLDSNPIFIGLAPADADLTMVSFFSSGGGVFLCTGGRASDDLISALGAPGGPAFFYLGERHFASLPNPKPGQSMSVHYTEGTDSGEVRFFISDADGEEIKSDRPPLVKGLPLGLWRPCVLLCMPGTRVHIARLI